MSCSVYLSRQQTRTALTPSVFAAALVSSVPGPSDWGGDCRVGLVLAKIGEASSKNQCLRIRFTFLASGLTILGHYSDGSSYRHSN